MTYRERFEAAMEQRGYKVSRLGLITVLEHGDYAAYHYFTAEGKRNLSEKPVWFSAKSIKQSSFSFSYRLGKI